VTDTNGRWPRWTFFSEPFSRVEKETRQRILDDRALDWKVMVVLLVTAVSLTLQHYVFQARHLGPTLELAEKVGAGSLTAAVGNLCRSPQDWHLAGLIFWIAGTLFTYVVIPTLVIKLLFRQRLRDYGLKVRGMFRTGWVYLLMFAFMVPFIAAFSTTGSFQAMYPFYRVLDNEQLWPRFWIWEAFYLTQFFALEFFFRGFILHGTRHRFGFYAIFVMMVPYCMIHYGKPMPETFGAIGAGIILGFMSLKTRSIWLGAAIHVGVALSMDLLALWHRGMFP